MASYNSIVDYLNALGKPSSFAARKKLAQSMGISNYTGTAAQNTKLLQSMQGGSQTTSQTAPQASRQIDYVQPVGAQQTTQGYTAPQARSLDTSSTQAPPQAQTPQGGASGASNTSSTGGAAVYQNGILTNPPPVTTPTAAPLSDFYKQPAQSNENPENVGKYKRSRYVQENPNIDPNTVKANADGSLTILTPDTSKAHPQPPTQDQFSGIGSGLSGDEKATMDSLIKMARDLISRGQQINPYVTVSPDTLAKFVDQARSELGPAYDNNLKVARDLLVTSLGGKQQDLQAAEDQYQKQYSKGVRQIGEQSAEQGFAQSGRRMEQEQQYAQDTQAALDANRRQLSLQAYGQGAQFAQQFGGQNVPNVNIGGAPRVLPGQEQFQKGSPSPLYSLSPDVYSNLAGTDAQAKELGARTLGGQYAQAKSNEALGQHYQTLTGQRQITI